MRDYSRYVDVESRAGSHADGPYPADMGDPTRWGGSAQLHVPRGPVGGFRGLLTSPQVVRVQGEDPYPRNFGLFGVLVMPEEYWDAPEADFVAGLELLLGAGQITVRAALNIKGLALSQGGLWLPEPGVDALARPFSVFGFPMLIARALAARLVVDVPGDGAGVSEGDVRVDLLTANISGGVL